MPHAHVVARPLHVLLHVLWPRDALVVEELARMADRAEPRVAEVLGKVLDFGELLNDVHGGGVGGVVSEN